VARPGGRTARIRTAVLDATVAELVDRGFAGLTVEAVSFRAGVNKTTIYRRWGSREGLIVDAVETFAATQVDLPDTGTIEEDLRLWARSVLKTLTGPVSGALVRAVFSAAGDSPEVRELRHRFWLIRAALVRPLIEKAIRRGQLPAGTDADEVIRHVGAPLYYRLLVLAEPLSGTAADLAAAVATIAAKAGVFAQFDESRQPDPDEVAAQNQCDAIATAEF
jgi:AcrR family transcriptional regulator